jgi:hypothetical protein
VTVGRFVGADPVALVGLAETLGQYALRIRAVGQAIGQPMLRLPSTGERMAGDLVSVEAALVLEADELRWRARVIDAAQDVETNALFGPAGPIWQRIEFASLAVLDVANWEEAHRQWLTLPEPAALLRLTPAEVSALFSSLAPSLARSYARTHAGLVGSLDGAPPHLRYSANEVLLAAEIEDLRARIADLEASEGRSWTSWFTSTFLIDWHSPPELSGLLIGHYERQIEEYQRWLNDGRQILLFQPGGDGRVVEVFGDLATADHVGIAVPGMSNDLSNFSEVGGGFRQNAARLYESSLDLGGSNVATIAWLGYDSPDGIGAAVRSAAKTGAPALRRFVEGIDPQADKQITVIAHSYGSVVAGLAAGEGLAADDLVFVGSPGTTLDSAADAILRPGGRVWVALADDDPIGLGISPRELPPAWVPPSLLPAVLAVDLAMEGPEELWHGTNPAAEEFGAVRMTTEGSSGHSAYFEAGSLINLALIVQGLHDDVELVD